MEVLGSNLNEMMLGMSLVKSPYSSQPMPAIAHTFFSYLEVNKVNITKEISKSLDTCHTITSDQLVSNNQRVLFFNGINPPENEHMVIFGMRVLTGVSANINETAWVPGVSDANILNGKFEIRSNGITVMNEHSFSDFTQAEEEPYSGWIKFPKPLIWQAQTEFVATGIFDTVVATANTNMRIQFFGSKLIG